jgi:hypothetical protein
VWRLLDDSDFRPKPSEHLGELEADVTAPDDDEVLWHLVERQDRRVRQVTYFVNAWHVGDECAPTDVDEDARRRQLLLIHADDIRGFKPGVALNHRAAVHAA